MKKSVDEALFKEIDVLNLGDRILAWKEDLKQASWKLYAEREKYTVESWNETKGEDIQIRRAMLFKKVVDNLPIAIKDYDIIVGRPTPGVIGALTSIDVCGDYIPEIWQDTDKISNSISGNVGLDKESLEILRASANLFRDETTPEKTYKAWYYALGNWASDAEAAKIKDPVLDIGIFGNSTSALNWQKLLKMGFRGIINEAMANIEEFRKNRETDADKLYFWNGTVIVLEASINYSHRYADLARNMAAKESGGKRREELLEIARICEKVPEYAPETLREALQLMSIASTCKLLEHPMHNFSQWGRPDQYLYDFFMNDLEKGAITLQEAGDMFAELIGRWGTQIFFENTQMKESHQVNFGINNLMIGGYNTKHEDASNELSYFLLHIVGLLKQSSPTVGLRWTKDTPIWLMEKAIRTNKETGGGIPLFESDETVIASFEAAGVSFEEASEWCGLGCVYPTLPLSKVERSGADGCGAFNLAAFVDMALHNGITKSGHDCGPHTGDPRNFKSFDELYDAFKAQLKYVMYNTFWLAEIARDEQPKYFRSPFLSSCSLQQAMDKGQDLLVPDPDCIQLGISDRAYIDAGDSLYAVKKLVFDDKALSMDELLKALDSNFEGSRGEEIRQMCLAAPKFGNDIDEVDNLVANISTYSSNVIRSYDNSPYPPFIVAREGVAWHYYGGLGVGALPDGRKAFEPLNDGSNSPMRGADKHGPTAVLRSVLKIPSEDTHVAVLNQKFNDCVLNSPESIDKFVIYTQAFMKNGGSHIQYNIMSQEELLEAKAHPEDYHDLVVRVGGFSAYFTQLSPQIQDDIILRSEHSM